MYTQQKLKDKIRAPAAYSTNKKRRKPSHRKESNLNLYQRRAWVKRRPLDVSAIPDFAAGRTRLHHAHIIFDDVHDLRDVGRQDNVGYHARSGTGGPGELFSENWRHKGYVDDHAYALSTDDLDDWLVVKAIDEVPVPPTYKLQENDCQTWAASVARKVERLKNLSFYEQPGNPFHFGGSVQ